FILADWLEASLPDENFDAVIAIESSEHVADKREFFARAHRALRSGGRFVLCGWLVRERVSEFERRFLLDPICRESRMPPLGSEESYRALFSDSGFAVDSFEDLNAHVKKTWPRKVR